MSRETFELRSGEHKTFMESTKSMVLLGTSKWFAKIIVKGWNLDMVSLFVTLLDCPAAEYLSSMLLSANCKRLQMNICHCCPMWAPVGAASLANHNRELLKLAQTPLLLQCTHRRIWCANTLNGGWCILWARLSLLRTVFNVNPDTHIESLESSEKHVVEGTSKWSCKIKVSGKMLSRLNLIVCN